MNVPELRERLRWQVIPAVPTPFTNSGVIHTDGLQRYVAYMQNESPGGIAVWAHTGRGLLLSEEQRAIILSAWRNAFPKIPIIAGAGGNPNEQTDEAYIASASEMAEHAKSLGADAILCYAPQRFRNYEKHR